MEKDIARLRTHVGRSKLAIFAIAGFLGLLTYLMISLSNQIASLSVQTQSQASQTIETAEAEPQQMAESAVSCGEACAYESASDQWDKPCGEGYSCQKIQTRPIGGGIVGWCRPTQGGSCPLPIGTCGSGCADESGNITHQCSSGTTCESVDYLGYKICMPPTGESCELYTQ